MKESVTVSNIEENLNGSISWTRRVKRDYGYMSYAVTRHFKTNIGRCGVWMSAGDEGSIKIVDEDKFSLSGLDKAGIRIAIKNCKLL